MKFPRIHVVALSPIMLRLNRLGASRMVATVLPFDPRNVELTPLDPGPVFEAFAGFLTGAEGGGQYHAANRAPASKV